MASSRPARKTASAARKAMSKPETNANSSRVSKSKATTKTATVKKTAKSKPDPPASKNKANVGRPRKRKAEADNEAAPPSKAARATAKDTTARVQRHKVGRKPRSVPTPKEAEPLPVTINHAPTKPLKVFVFGSNQQGELGLGQGTSVNDVKRPRLNPLLDSTAVGVVQLSIGALHAAALSKDNKILTWGVNDLGALGRDTDWEGGMKDMKDDDESDSSEGEVNPKEATPTEVDMSVAAGKTAPKWVQVAAGDNATFALSEKGEVYGWGTFKATDGATHFASGINIARRPIHFPTAEPITKIVAGANHALALTSSGTVLAWGNNEDSQLGRTVNPRTRHLSPLEPQPFGLRDKFVDIGTGSSHSFAIQKNGSIYAWGKNNFCQTGIEKMEKDYFANISRPTVVKSLKGKGKIVGLTGGESHTIALTESGAYLSWGRCDTFALGLDLDAAGANAPPETFRRNQRDQPVILTNPLSGPPLPDLTLSHISASSDHTIVVDKAGKAWSSGFSGNHQTGQGQDSDVKSFTMIDNTAIREQKVVWAGCGAQFSALAAEMES